MGFACPFTKPSLPIKCILYAHTLMAPEALSPTGCLTNVYSAPSPVCANFVVCLGLLYLQGTAVIGLHQSG